MICNSSLLFIHVPKTGGMAITDKLLHTLQPSPIYYSLPAKYAKGLPKRDIRVVEGDRHGTLADAKAWVNNLGFKFEEFRVILSAIRNPYDMEVSRYFYLRFGHSWDKGPAQDLAMAGNFERFAVESDYFGRMSSEIYKYFVLEGEIPANMRILRFEDLEMGLKSVYKDLDIEYGVPMKSENKSKHGPFLEYLTPAAEEAIYLRYRWLFDQDYYQRIRL